MLSDDKNKNMFIGEIFENRKVYKSREKNPLVIPKNLKTAIIVLSVFWGGCGSGHGEIDR